MAELAELALWEQIFVRAYPFRQAGGGGGGPAKKFGGAAAAADRSGGGSRIKRRRSGPGVSGPRLTHVPPDRGSAARRAGGSGNRYGLGQRDRTDHAEGPATASAIDAVSLWLSAGPARGSCLAA